MRPTAWAETASGSAGLVPDGVALLLYLVGGVMIVLSQHTADTTEQNGEQDNNGA